MNINNYFVLATYALCLAYDDTIKGRHINVKELSNASRMFTVKRILAGAGYISDDIFGKITHEGIMFLYENPFIKGAFKWIVNNPDKIANEFGYCPNVFYPDSDEYDAFIVETWEAEAK